MKTQTLVKADCRYRPAIEGGAHTRSARGLVVLAGVLAILALGGSARAQTTNGTVNFCNNSSNLVVFLQGTNPVAASSGIKAALYWAPVGSSSFVMLGTNVAVGVPLPGIFAGGTRVAGPGTAGGAVGQFQVRAWAGTNTSYERAFTNGSSYSGVSAIITMPTGNPTNAAPTPPASLVAGGFQGFGLGQAPVIIVPPTNQTVRIGRTAVLTVTAIGAIPLSYQWQFNGTNLADSTHITGSLSTALTILNFQTGDAGSYRVIVTNLYGVAISTNAVLTVDRSCVPPPAGLVAWWRGEGNANDSVGSANGVLYQAVTFAPGNVGQCFAFNGVNGAVNVPDVPALVLTNSLSIECWLFVTNGPTVPGMVLFRGDTRSGLDPYYLDVEPNGGAGSLNFILVNPFNSSDSVSTVMSLGAWTHVVVTLDDATGLLRLYTNAVVAAQKTTMIRPLGPLDPGYSPGVGIGNHSSQPAPFNYPFRGRIDEVSMYNRALTAAEVRGLYNANGAGKCLASPPVIVVPPTNQIVFPGSNAAFTVLAAGSPTLAYQWRFNGSNILAATTDTLTITNVQLTNVGNYQVIVTNPYGSVTSVVATLTLVPPPPCAVPPSGLVSWWRAEANARDSAGSNDGALLNGATFAPGMVGQAFNFNPSNSTVLVPDSSSLRLTSQLTIEAWIKTRTLAGSWGYGIVCKDGGAGGNNGYQLILSGNTLIGEFNSPGQGWPSARVTSGPIINTGVWYHVAWTYDQSAMKLYCNGQPVAANVIGAHAIATSSSNLRISGDDNNVAYFDGLIDEASVYNRALSATEIAAIYNAGSSGKCLASPPVIVVPPTNQIVLAGSNAVFTVLAAGSPILGCQWRFNGTNTLAATTSTLTIANAQLTNAGNYQVIVTNAYGSATSPVATLTVVFPPQIIVQPTNQTVLVGSNATFTVTVTGTAPLSYQWRFNGTNLTDGTHITGSLTPALTILNVQPNDAGSYQLIVTNLYGVAVSSNAVLTVVGICMPPPSGLVSWWRAEANARDSVGSNNGALLNGAAFAPGMVGQAFSFNGSNSYVEVPDSPALRLTNQLTVEFWVKRQQVDWPNDYLLNKGGDWIRGALNYGVCFAPASLGSHLAFLFAGGNRHTTGITDLNWHHCAIVARNGDADPTFYLDGVQQPITRREGASTISLYPSTEPLRIGAQVDLISGWLYYGKAIVDELSIYNRALSASEIQAIYNAYDAGKCPPARPVLINVNFAAYSQVKVGSAGTGQTSSDFWNNYTAPWQSYAWLANLKMADGTPTTVGLTVQNGAGHWAFAHPDLMYNCYCYSQNHSDITLTVTNLASGQYDFYLYGHEGSASGNTVFQVLVGGADYGNQPTTTNSDWALTNWVEGAQYVVYRNVAVTNGGAPVTITAHPGLAGDAQVNGMQITASPPRAPVIAVQPTNQTVLVGSNATFSVTATGTVPLSYQWRWNGTNIAGATGTALTLTNVQPAQAGNYAVWVTNTFGSILSSNALLTVTLPSCATPPAGLIAWWKGEGNALDQIGTANGTLAGSVTYGAGRVGQAFVCGSAQGDAVRVGNPASLQIQDLSIEAWVRRASPTEASSGPYANGTFFGYGSGGYSFGSAADGSLILSKSWYTKVTTSPGLLSDTNFHHVAVTKSGSTVVFYLDGAAYPVAAYNPGFTFATNAALGALGDLSNDFWGTVDELSIYNRALAPTEIRAIYNAGSSGKCSVATPPTITSQPTNQAVLVGSNATFAVTATGTPPLSYQWWFNGTNALAATTATLSIPNAQLTNAGGYSVVITNNYGGTTSLIARLSVALPPRFQSVSVRTGSLTMTWNGATGFTYQVQYKTNLTQLYWSNSGGPIFATGNIVTGYDVIGPDRQRFYRVTFVP